MFSVPVDVACVGVEGGEGACTSVTGVSEDARSHAPVGAPGPQPKAGPTKPLGSVHAADPEPEAKPCTGHEPCTGM